MIDKEKYITRLNIEIDKEVLKKIKIRSAEKNITLRKWVLRAITKELIEEESYE